MFVSIGGKGTSEGTIVHRKANAAVDRVVDSMLAMLNR